MREREREREIAYLSPFGARCHLNELSPPDRSPPKMGAPVAGGISHVPHAVEKKKQQSVCVCVFC